MIEPDKYEILDRIGQQGLYTFDGESYEMQLRITDACNYKCPYCHWRFGKHYLFEDIKQTAAMAVDLIGHDNYRIYFHGGEPTTHPKCLEVISYLFDLDKNIIVELQTNLTAKKNYINKLIQDFKTNKLEINVSYHPSQVKCFESFVDKLQILYDNNVLGKIDVMLEHDEALRDTIIENSNHLLDQQYSDRIEFIHGYINYDNSSDVYRDFVAKNSKFTMRYKVTDRAGKQRVYDTSELYEQGINFKGWKCSAGKEYIIVNGNGDYYMCCANMFDDKPAGNLLTNPQMFKVRTRYHTTCKWCTCQGEFYLEKFK